MYNTEESVLFEIYLALYFLGSQSAVVCHKEKWIPETYRFCLNLPYSFVLLDSKNSYFEKSYILNGDGKWIYYKESKMEEYSGEIQTNFSTLQSKWNLLWKQKWVFGWIQRKFIINWNPVKV